jgi:dipeptidyl aminopeptidase/acylaminoacyl peptidase
LRWQLSPINHVENVTTPILIIHGVGRPPITPDSKLFVDQLRRYNKVFRYMTYPNEVYYIHGIENQRQEMIDKLKFLDLFLKDKIVLE